MCIISASLALQNAIRDARTAPPARDEAPAASASATGHTDDHNQNHDQEAAAPHAVDHPGRDVALTPAQQAAAIQAHQQAAMPELLEGRTTDPETWMHSPKNLARLAALKLEADARGRAVAEHQLKQSGQPEQSATDTAGPADQQQHHTPRPDQGSGPARGR